MRIAELRRVAENGDYDVYLPDFASLEFGDDVSDIASVTVDYPRDGRFFDAFEHKAEFAILIEGREIPNGRFVFEETSGNRITDEPKLATFACQSLIAQCKDIVVYPRDWREPVPEEAAENRRFTDTTPGRILSLFIDEAHERGVMEWLTYDFTERDDSAGDRWDETPRLDVIFEAGVNLLEVLQWLRDNGFVEYRMFARELRVYNPGTGRDRTKDDPPVILQKGRHLLDGPYQQSTAELKTRVLVKGDEKRWALVVDEDAENRWGIYEGFLHVSGVTRRQVLERAGRAYLNRYARIRRSETYEVELVQGQDPYRSYHCGDWIFIDHSGTPVRERVIKTAATFGDGGLQSAALTVSDWFDEWDIRLARRIERLSEGK